jgi:hypothetical protein
MPTQLLYPGEIDVRLNWPAGQTARLVRRGRLPHYLLPDGSVRLCWEEVVGLVRRVPCAADAGKEVVNAS